MVCQSAANKYISETFVVETLSIQFNIMLKITSIEIVCVTIILTIILIIGTVIVGSLPWLT